MSPVYPSVMAAVSPSTSKAGPSISDAFWQRWRHHRPFLLQQCIRMLRCQPSDAEDVVSITLINALQQLSRPLSPIVNERAWLSRILYNACMDIHRHRRRFGMPVNPEGEELAENRPYAAFQDMGLSPEEVWLAREQAQALNRHVQRLPPKLRTPFVMRFHKDMSYPEIAAKLNLTNCNVRKRIQLAYSQLRKACVETM